MADGDDDIEVVELDRAVPLAIGLALNLCKSCISCSAVELALFEHACDLAQDDTPVSLE